MNKLILPKKKNVFKTNDEDPIFFYYLPVIGYIYKKRLTNSLDLLKTGNKRLLDIGYGSGLLFPSLLQTSDICYGLENHGQEDKVYEMLAKENIDKNKVILGSGDILNLPYQDKFFDSIICISTLEHIADPDKALGEISRILADKGEAILSFPARNTVTDLFYRTFGYNPRAIHPSSHTDIINAAKKYFTIEKTITIPNIKFINYSIYWSIKCIKK